MFVFQHGNQPCDLVINQQLDPGQHNQQQQQQHLNRDLDPGQQQQQQLLHSGFNDVKLDRDQFNNDADNDAKSNDVKFNSNDDKLDRDKFNDDVKFNDDAEFNADTNNKLLGKLQVLLRLFLIAKPRARWPPPPPLLGWPGTPGLGVPPVFPQSPPP